MDTLHAVYVVEGVVEAESEDEVREAWQHLHDTGIAYQMQGWYGRTAKHLVETGVING